MGQSRSARSVEKSICQLIFEIVDGTPEKGYEGRFSIQGPTIPPTS
jgi:hypothetical protein